MKKLFMLSAILIAMICFVQQTNAQTTATANLSFGLTVSKYIETTPNVPLLNFGATSQRQFDPNRESLAASSPLWNLAYSNTGFTATISGNNLKGEGKPRFARAEVGTHAGGGWDVLPTSWSIFFTTNGERDAIGGLSYNNPQAPANRVEAQAFPISKDYLETPHNGQIAMDLSVYVNCGAESTVPLRMTLINPAFTNDQSADAGDYACTMLVTLTAL